MFLNFTTYVALQSHRPTNILQQADCIVRVIDTDWLVYYAKWYLELKFEEIWAKQ